MAALGLTGVGGLGASTLKPFDGDTASAGQEAPADTSKNMGDNAEASINDIIASEEKEQGIMSDAEEKKLLDKYTSDNNDAKNERNKRTIDEQLKGDPLMMDDLEKGTDRDPQTGAPVKSGGRTDNKKDWEDAGIDSALGTELMNRILGQVGA